MGQPTHTYCATCGAQNLETCRQCRQPRYCDACGLCNRCGEPRKRAVATRQWIVRARWLLRRKGVWTPWAESRVNARGPLGALTKGHQQLRQDKPARVQVLQHDLQVLPIGRGKGVYRA